MKKTEILKYLKSLPGEEFVSEVARLFGEGEEIPASMIKRLEEYNRVLGMREFDLSKGTLVAGVDEAGRGPLAGHVYTAAVILPQNVVIEGLNDSKKLSEKKRDELYDIIIEKALYYNIVYSDCEIIDKINIRNATLNAMKEAAEGLPVRPDKLLIDGNALPKTNIPCEFVIKGDSKSMAIAAASILAKVTRDRYIKEMDEIYPEYGFSKNKGYGTADHIEAIKKYGPCPIHRRTFIKNFI
ncbi:MAG: ribonuclease HII [Clostridia bacterium]|nr:ribonuclease HII [Clostridia bacterium]